WYLRLSAHSSRHAEHDGDRRRCTLGRECRGEASGCDDHRDLPANQLGRKFGESLHLLGPAVVGHQGVCTTWPLLAKPSQVAIVEEYGSRPRDLVNKRRLSASGLASFRSSNSCAKLTHITSSIG